MHSIQIHKVIGLLISTFYLIGAWHRGDKPTFKEIRMKLFYCIYYFLFLVASVGGIIKNEKKDDSIFLVEVSMGILIVWINLSLAIWKQNEILNFLNVVCVFSIRNGDDCLTYNAKLRGLIKFAFVFLISLAFASFSCVFSPLVGSEKILFIKIVFPLDYKNSEIAFWIATAFLFTEFILTVTFSICTVLIWYLLLVCALRYEVLGGDLKNMGRVSSENGNVKMTQKQIHIKFLEDLKTSIKAHLHIKGLVEDVELFLSDLFFIQFGTSALCICGAIYCVAFDVGETLLERYIYVFVVFYYISHLYMITNYGNEIMLSSNRLSYCLFESDWYNQTQSTKKCVIIFGEYLKQPQTIVIAKLYPLDLTTFTRILNSAYSMFNILKSFQ
ncbi:putative odorant receptor 71a [Bradysia coprophila]|uniref:putative odorant receptor 71a n=1 Tax=Bradysia coprophila TaxID=38358 RepID=UPI00187D97C8|nr:putative odorant receptor 71a [Bradysia coprophila]